MIRVAAFTQGQWVPSARFRVRQFLPHLRKHGIEMREYWSRFGAYPGPARWTRPIWAAGNLAHRTLQVAAARNADLTLLQREFLSSYATLEGATKRPRVFDLDDAVFLLRGGRAAAAILRRCDAAICGNSFLANWALRHCSRVTIIPTAVDTERYRPTTPVHGEKPRQVIGWIGSSANADYLRMIEPALARVLAGNRNCRLKIICDRPPELRNLNSSQVIFSRWSEETEIAEMSEFSIGIMPLRDSDWARGKCSFKMLQYMALGLPVVVSPVGMNAEVLHRANVGFGAATELEWESALAALLSEPGLRSRLGLAGRAVVEEFYSVNAVTPLLANTLTEVATRS